MALHSYLLFPLLLVSFIGTSQGQWGFPGGTFFRVHKRFEHFSEGLSKSIVKYPRNYVRIQILRFYALGYGNGFQSTGGRYGAVQGFGPPSGFQNLDRAFPGRLPCPSDNPRCRATTRDPNGWKTAFKTIHPVTRRPRRFFG